MRHVALEGPIACMFSSPKFSFHVKPTQFSPLQMGASALVLEKNKIEEACTPWSMPLKESSFPSCDVPMAQYIINMNASLPASDKFIIHVLDSTHMFVQPHVELMIRSQIAKFREDNTYVKPN
ncbi:hypothetical protein VNO80_12092 [Phaseolus coccineus]|uniref:General transcription and DNA repair factor IIH subunit TFB5 n=1 Tax=Phaseolus coccineus TaxID=3886 RepID=A0AAN9RC01_PHACN